ncbi:hypothetical protein [Flagellimonas marinaquae]|uniref:hypothetical protein n=1 Tax=Flagellimonas marinaquae TaxID=254955 RepID=UPI0030C69F91
MNQKTKSLTLNQLDFSLEKSYRISQAEIIAGPLGRILKASGLNQVATLLRNSRPLGIRPNALLNQIANAVGTGSPRPHD